MALEEDLHVYVSGHLYRLFATCASIRSDFFAAAINFQDPRGYPHPLQIELSDERVEEFEFILPFLDLRHLSPLELCVKDHTLVPQLVLGDKFQIPLVMHTCEHVMLRALATSSPSPVTLNELLIAHRFNLKQFWQQSTKAFLNPVGEYPARTLVSLLEEVHLVLSPEKEGSMLYRMFGTDVFNDVVTILWLAALSALEHCSDDDLKNGFASINTTEFLKATWNDCRICYDDFQSIQSSPLCQQQTISCFLPLVLNSLHALKAQVVMYPGIILDNASSLPLKRDYMRAYQKWATEKFPDQFQGRQGSSSPVSVMDIMQAVGPTPEFSSGW